MEATILSKKKSSIIRAKITTNILLLIAVISSAIFSVLVYDALSNLNSANLNRYESFRLREELRLSSDQLTLMARAYVVTGNPKFRNFFYEILDIRNGVRPRPIHYDRVYWDFRMPENGVAPQALGGPVSYYNLLQQADISEEEIRELSLAQEESDKLVELEEQAFELTSRALREAKFRYSVLREQALDLVYGEEYLNAKVDIMSHINTFIELQEARTADQVKGAYKRLRYLALSTILSYVLLLTLLLLNNGIQRKLDGNLITELESEVARRSRTEEQIRKSLAERNVLLRELNHRTKNTLQQIQGLLTLQAANNPGNHEIEELICESRTRIQSIAVVHQLLYQSQDLSHLSIKNYITELCSMLKSSFGVSDKQIHFHLDITDKKYLFDEVIPIGLIVNELVTNSLKYAFPNEREGKISISVESGNHATTILEYSDNGIGVPDDFDFENQNSLGIQLVFNITKNQLLGKIEMKNVNGIYCRIEFPNNLYEERL